MSLNDAYVEMFTAKRSISPEYMGGLWGNFPASASVPLVPTNNIFETYFS